MPAACAPSVVSSAVRMVTTISPILFSVFFVDSFIRLTPDPSLSKRGAASA